MPLANSYATVDDFNLFCDSLQQLDQPPIETDRLEAALIAASDYANSMFARRYEVPVSGWGKELVRVVCTIALHRLDYLSDREIVWKLYQEAIAWLKSIGEGEAILVSGTGEIIPVREDPIGIDAKLPTISLLCI